MKTNVGQDEAQFKACRFVTGAFRRLYVRFVFDSIL